MKKTSDELASQRIGFAVFVIVITMAMIWSVWAFAGAILWGVVLAVVFDPVKEWLLRRMPGRTRTAAGLTLLAIAAGIIVPLLILVGMIANEAIGVATRLQTRQIDPGGLFTQLLQHLPGWARDALARGGIGDLADVGDRLGSNVQSILRMAGSQVLAIGSNVLGFLVALVIALYLAFVFLCDGRAITRRASEIVPLAPRRFTLLADNFVSVVRATVKGSIVVAFAQGLMGGIIMALLGVPEPLLWAMVMMVGALLPAVGTGLVWVPVALYLFATGQVWQGVVMALSGAFLIGSIDNVLRPILVGRATQIPDALVLVTTLGGLSAFGINGLLLGPVIASLFLATGQMLREDNPAVDTE